MRKIRKVTTGSGTYFVYDLVVDSSGKRKRVYGKSIDEVKKKIEAAEQERKHSLSYQKPNNTNLREYIMFYFKSVVGTIHATRLNRLINIVDNAVSRTQLNRDVQSITREEIAEFYVKLSHKYSFKDVIDIIDVLRKTFALAAESGLEVVDISDIASPQKEDVIPYASGYIMAEKELVQLRNYCIQENCVMYGINELVLIFCLFTGLRFQKAKTIHSYDVNLEKKIIVVDDKPFPLTEECCQWLEQMRESKILEMPSAQECTDSSIGITRYTNLLFVNKLGNSPTVNSLKGTLTAITNRLGMPLGIISKTIHQAVIISELEKGVSEKELAKRYGYKTERAISNIRAAYILQNKFL